jgi:hypothetical protein
LVSGVEEPSGLEWSRAAKHRLTKPEDAVNARSRPNLRAVQELLGHAWVTTQRSTHLDVDDLQEQMAEMPASHSDR